MTLSAFKNTLRSDKGLSEYVLSLSFDDEKKAKGAISELACEIYDIIYHRAGHKWELSAKEFARMANHSLFSKRVYRRDIDNTGRDMWVEARIWENAGRSDIGSLTIAQFALYALAQSPDHDETLKDVWFNQLTDEQRAAEKRHVLHSILFRPHAYPWQKPQYEHNFDQIELAKELKLIQ